MLLSTPERRKEFYAFQLYLTATINVSIGNFRTRILLRFHHFSVKKDATVPDLLYNKLSKGDCNDEDLDDTDVREFWKDVDEAAPTLFFFRIQISPRFLNRTSIGESKDLSWNVASTNNPNELLI